MAARIYEAGPINGWTLDYVGPAGSHTSPVIIGRSHSSDAYRGFEIDGDTPLGYSIRTPWTGLRLKEAAAIGLIAGLLTVGSIAICYIASSDQNTSAPSESVTNESMYKTDIN